MTGHGALGGRADVAQFSRLAGKTSRLAPAIKRNLRNELRGVGQHVVTDIQRTVRETPGSGGAGPSTGLREDIAAGVKLTISTGAHPGIVIREATNNQTHPRGLVVGYGKPGGWRHPIFGTDTWVAQKGRPYLVPVIKTHQGEATIAVHRALQKAADTLR